MKITATFIAILLVITLKAQLAITVPANFEQKKGSAFIWTDDADINQVCLAGMSAIQSASDSLWLLYNSPSDTSGISLLLNQYGMTMEGIRFQQIASTAIASSHEIPPVGYASFGADLVPFIYQPLQTYANDSLAGQLAQYWNMERADLDVRLDPTLMLSDGILRGFGSRKLLQVNPGITEEELAATLKDAFGLTAWWWFDTIATNDKGINRWMQITDFQTMLLTEVPDTNAFYETLEMKYSEMANLLTYFNTPYTIFRLPACPGPDGSFPSDPAELRTYTSSILYNDKVMVPQYGMLPYDSIALSAYTQAMPGYDVVPVDVSNMESTALMLSDLTLYHPPDHYLRIEHRKVSGIQEFSENFQITCLSKSGEMVTEMWLWYRLNQDTTWQRTTVHLVCPEHFGIIPGLLPSDTVTYFLEAFSTNEHTTYPMSAEKGGITFWFDPTTNTRQYEDKGLRIWPNPTQGTINFRLPDGWPEAEITLQDMAGHVIISRKVVDARSFTLPVVTPGIYLLRFNNNKQEEVQRIIIH